MTTSPQPESPEPLKVAKKIEPGSELHFALLATPMGWNFLTGKDYADMQAFAKAVWEAAIQAARNEAEAMRVKAARYDWLSSKAYTEGRDGGTNGFWRLPFVDGWGCEYPSMREYHHATLDSAIDAAMKGDAHADQA